jgi:hypothetical protein
MIDPGNTARDQLIHHGVQQADDLGAGPAEVTVAFGLHIQHPLTRRQQLLSQQMAHAALALNCPGPLGRAAAHASSRSAWTAEARTAAHPAAPPPR